MESRPVSDLPQPVFHTLEPVYDAQSRVLLLGTMPSPRSREAGFYYAHPQNRFWSVLASLFDASVPQTAEARRAFALTHGIALWDVLARCEIRGADDASIRRPVANDIAWLLRQAPIRAVFTTGGKAFSLYQRLCLPQTGMPAVLLPSTSPANCRMSHKALEQAYARILDALTSIA